MKNLLASWFRNLTAFEGGPVKQEFSIIDPTAASADGGLNTVVLAVDPSDGNSPTIVSLYFDASGVKLFEKKYQDDNDAQTEMSAMATDLNEAATLSKTGKIEEAKKLAESLFDKYKRHSDPLANEQPTLTMTQASLEPTQYKGWKISKLPEGGYIAEHDVMSLRADSIDTLKAKIDNIIRKAYGKQLKAGITMQNLFFDSVDEAMEFQEKTKELQGPEGSEEGKPLWEQMGNKDEQVAPSNETKVEEDNELAPPSLSFDRIEKDKAKTDKDIGKRIKDQVKTEVESALEQKSASVFGKDQEELVEALKKNGRNWDEIKKIFVKDLSYNEDDTAVFLDSMRQKEEGGTPEGFPLPPKPPEDLVSPETHDKLVKEVTDKSEPKPEPLPLADEIARADNAEIRKVAVKKVALKLWERASNYMGDDLSDYYMGPAIGYEKEPLEVSNFNVTLKMLGGEGNGVLVGSFGGFGGGYEQIFVHKDAADKVAILQDIENKLQNYPVLDDDDYSEREMDAQRESYESWAKPDALRIIDEELHRQNPDLQGSASELELSPEINNQLASVVFDDLSYGDGTALNPKHLLEEAEESGLLNVLRNKLEGKEVVPENPNQMKLFETSLKQRILIKALHKRALNPLQEPPAVGQNPGQPLAAPIEEAPTFDSPVPPSQDTNPEPEFLEAPKAGDRVYVMGDYETGEDGYEGTMVSDYTSKGDEYAVISKDDGENAEVALHRVVKASQKKVAKAYYEKVAGPVYCKHDGCKRKGVWGRSDGYWCDKHLSESTQQEKKADLEGYDYFCPKCKDQLETNMEVRLHDKSCDGKVVLRSPEEQNAPEHKEADLEKDSAQNADVIRMFLEDSFPKDKMPVWGTPNLKITKYPNGWALVNYQTPILYRGNDGVIVFNTQKYSPTTSKIQNTIRSMFAGQSVKETDEAGIHAAIDQANLANDPEIALSHSFKEPKIEEEDLHEDSPELQSLHESALKLKAEFDEVSAIMAFEEGSLDNEGVLELFSNLVKNGHAWSLQGSYGRAAKSLIDSGYLDEQGNILKHIEASLNKQASGDSAFEANGWTRVWVDESEIEVDPKYPEVLKLPDENARIAALKAIARDIAEDTLRTKTAAGGDIAQMWFDGLKPSDHDRIDWVALANPQAENVESAQNPKIEKKAEGENWTAWYYNHLGEHQHDEVFRNKTEEEAQAAAKENLKSGWTFKLHKGPKHDASLKQAADPIPTPEAPKELPTTLKQWQKAPKDTDKEKAIPATVEQAQLVKDVESSLSSLEAIKSLVTQAKAKLAEEVRAIEEKGGRVQMEGEVKEKVERLSKLVEATQNQMIAAGDTLVRLVQETKEHPFKPSDKWKVEKLTERLSKYEDAAAFLKKAEDGAQHLATSEDTRELYFFPRKMSKLHKAAGFLETLDSVYNDVMEALKLIIGNEPKAEPIAE